MPTIPERVAAHLADPAHRAALPGIRRRLLAHPSTPGCRDNEWLCACLMILFAAALAWPGNSFAAPTYSAFDRFHFGEAFWGVMFAGFGMLRIVALWINGRSPKTPTARCLGAAVGMLGWSQLSIGLAVGSTTALGALSPGSMIYAGLFVAEARSLFRARYDARYLR